MKKALLALGLVLGCVSAHAEETIKFVNADGSPAGALCIAAISDEAGLTALAAQHGVAANELDSVYCNGRPLRKWVHQYRDADTQVTAYIINAANQSPESQLCLAAVTSDEEYSRILDMHFQNARNIENEIACNDMTLRQFVRKYRAHLANAPARETAGL